MSQRLISRSADLKRLRDEGYDVSIRGRRLVVSDVPYVTAARTIARGTIVVRSFALAGDVTATPTDHVVFFAGELPCDHAGSLLAVVADSTPQNIDDTLTTQHTFSRRPMAGAAVYRNYDDYYELITTYVETLGVPAREIDSRITAKTFPAIPADKESVHNYFDTASSRAGIAAMSERLALERVAIVGLGGTGSYVLDLVAKTQVQEIHLFDSDQFLNHNAFRAPGAPTLEQLQNKPSKVAYLAEKYAAMHRHVVPHEVSIDARTIDELRRMSFVFLCADHAETKRNIAASLTTWQIPFIDVGMGLYLVDEKVAGTLRITSSDAYQSAHVVANHRITGNSMAADGIYAQNVQVADLNALNAALAVIRWKKMFGFYNAIDCEYNSTYDIDGNFLINEDQIR
jgi:ThiF family